MWCLYSGHKRLIMKGRRGWTSYKESNKIHWEQNYVVRNVRMQHLSQLSLNYLSLHEVLLHFCLYLSHAWICLSWFGLLNEFVSWSNKVIPTQTFQDNPHSDTSAAAVRRFTACIQGVLIHTFLPFNKLCDQAITVRSIICLTTIPAHTKIK